MYMTDQQALSFLTQMSTYIEAEVDKVIYPDIQYPDLIPIDLSAPEWAKSVTRFISDKVGAAQWFNANARDVPRADVLMTKQEIEVAMAAIGYGYNLEELAQAQAMAVIRPGYRLDVDRADAARRAYEEFLDRVLLLGDTAKGFVGMSNNPVITVTPAAPIGNLNGAANSSLWANKTPDQQLADVNNALSGIYTGTNTVEWADTVLLPITRLLSFSSSARSATADTTILKFLQEANAYSAVTGRQLTVRGVRGLDTAGAGGTARMVAYRRDPMVLKAHIPMRHKFLAPMRTGPMIYEVPGIFRFGGLDIKRPGAMRYVDGI